ncbi:MAG: alkylphosphonate utilization protein [Rikenellaceae bacterium]|nr:alkylphosphonate utilization protein [Rikenellaceae bacterium]
MTEFPECPVCGADSVYTDGSSLICPICGHEWSGEPSPEPDSVPRDSNGTELRDGDAVTVIKDLKVKGSSMVIKRGTRVKSIRLTDDPDQVDCRIDSSGIVLKTCFLRK